MFTIPPIANEQETDNKIYYQGSLNANGSSVANVIKCNSDPFAQLQRQTICRELVKLIIISGMAVIEKDVFE